MIVSAKDLEDKNTLKKNARKELYTRILTQLCRKIHMYHELGRTECAVDIPEFIFGYPAYDLYAMTVYMHRQLTRLKYRTSVLEIGRLYIAWGPKPLKRKKKTFQVGGGVKAPPEDDDLPSLANLKKAADELRKKYTPSTK
jgi:hypothetical protein